MPRLKLPDITLVCINTVCHQLSDMAVAECCDHADFGDIKVFTNRKDVGIYIEPFKDQIEAGNFALYEMPKYIKTSHVLFIHWDSWIIDPGMWRDEFLQYDYVGAPWWYLDDYNVGNSGFSLRSKQLMEFLIENKNEFPLQAPEDHVLCRTYQPKLPQFTWASEKVATDFAFERSRPSVEKRHFGFHGMFNWPFVLPPPRLAERMALARKDPYVQSTNMLNELDHIAGALWVKV